MAARKLKPFHTDEIRAKIQASQLINRLTDHALGAIDLSSTQVRAIEVLLRKAVPDLSAVDLNANVQGDLNLIVETGVDRDAD